MAIMPKHADSSKCDFWCGKGVGGSTLINGLIYSRGHPEDYKIWKSLRNPGWTYDEILPYFKKSENFHKTDPEAVVNNNYHSVGGELMVEYHMPEDPQLTAIFKILEEMGYNKTDYNSPQEVGVSSAQINTKKGRRLDTGTAFIKPALKRTNLKVMTNSYVIKINADKINKKAEGVSFTNKGKEFVAYASKEVIVCAGALSSPRLLMLSGIGPRNHLKKLGIPLIADLEVGRNLKNHVQYSGLMFSINVSAVEKSLRDEIRDYLQGVGELTTSGTIGVGFFGSSLRLRDDYPDFEIMIGTFKILNETRQATNNGRSGLNLVIYNLHPHSSGTITLKNSSPYEYPLIDANYLSDRNNHDINVMYEGIQFVLRMSETKAFKDIDAKIETKTPPACEKFALWTEEYWKCCLRHMSGGAHHFFGTCVMGPDPKRGAVVDHDLQVHGIKHLRVADASVMPSAITGHTSAVCVMIGEKISDVIKQKYQ